MRRDDLSGGDLKRRKQCCRAMPLVIVALAGQGAAIGQLQITLRALDELLEGLAPKPSHVPRAVDDAQVAAAEIRDEPPGRDERRELHRSRLRLRPSASRSVSHLR